ncbi:hypothetical protein PIB30_050643 [Stylosanthes scabra]|uniref:Uncharacterized protein n=1 Tax=Stylosanthes scabra TaxID=79078 RepID=A0ABU6VHT9_9FABA|nr:hypothetical protein [Stylosanthes scabra]
MAQSIKDWTGSFNLVNVPRQIVEEMHGTCGPRIGYTGRTGLRLDSPDWVLSDMLLGAEVALFESWASVLSPKLCGLEPLWAAKLG